MRNRAVQVTVAKPTLDLFGLLMTIIRIRCEMGHKEKCCEIILVRYNVISWGYNCIYIIMCIARILYLNRENHVAIYVMLTVLSMVSYIYSSLALLTLFMPLAF